MSRRIEWIAPDASSRPRMRARTRAGGRSDQFVQYASAQVTETAANTLTFQQLQTGGMLFERRAMVFHRIEYAVNVGALDAEADKITFGWITNNQVTAPTLDDPNVIDLNLARRADAGAAASAQFYMDPYIKDFSALPGGGLIVPSHPLYLFAVGDSLASAVTITSRVFFTLKTLSAQDFIELVEALRVIT